jgi:hypothetical protein
VSGRGGNKLAIHSGIGYGNGDRGKMMVVAVVIMVAAVDHVVL